MIYILYSSIKEDNHNDLIDRYLPMFSNHFQNRIAKYRRWQDAQLSLLGRVLLKKGMEKVNCSFDESDLKYSDFNKPYFNSCVINFNISHSGEFVVCVLTDIGDVGIDIEKIDSIEINDFKSQMTPNEWEQISTSENTKNSFFKYWTQKEAIIKAHGKGLSIPLKSFEVQNNKTVIDTENFFLKKIKISNDYYCHLALKSSLYAKITIQEIIF
ncbi:4'-phosphopantetheinyl transferase [Aquimarina sp. MAR_2010_214]|uniref:4'-phosphopantetheinyl transferase family protein n=1 Tax=Aquimarina sp. MAR_2010_214 TaxID=1250026 RepID=UPI000C70FE7A|nr:4'-phosphopantetheinyl transferase superfamily protein [Aquimarina sp. MAR_2010_214]PKV49534.1 4'-phosphopantetheinyl transferase [Aquimarina sp. MAR_2010_214]